MVGLINKCYRKGPLYSKTDQRNVFTCIKNHDALIITMSEEPIDRRMTYNRMSVMRPIIVKSS